MFTALKRLKVLALKEMALKIESSKINYLVGSREAFRQ